MSDSTTEQLPLPAAADPVSADARKLQIALVDDDRNILTTVSIALQAEGFATRLYSDGETALKALLDNPPDLAVFDIKMPKMDGLELLARVREHSALPVIFLTSKDDESDEEMGLELGADLAALVRVGVHVHVERSHVVGSQLCRGEFGAGWHHVGVVAGFGERHDDRAVLAGGADVDVGHGAHHTAGLGAAAHGAVCRHGMVGQAAVDGKGWSL